MQLRDNSDALCAGGATLAAIGCGTAAQAGAFRKHLKLPFPVYTDPSLASFKAAGLRRDLGALNPLRMGANAVRAFLGGARQQGIQGDAFQVGGTFAFAAGGELLYAHRSKVAGDHAPLNALIAALV